MNSKPNILQFETIKQDFITFFKRKNLLPIVGTGISFGSHAFSGNIPSGTEYKQHMLKELELNKSFNTEEIKQIMGESFSRICDYYEDDDNVDSNKRFLYLKNNFFNTQLEDNDIRRKFLEIDWPYIYSLNIDDAIERSCIYSTMILPNRDFRDEVFDENKCLVKLHGDIREIVTYKDSSKIFTSKEYALSLGSNSKLLDKLRNDYANQNILYIGCSLDDELDLKTLSDLPIDFKAKDSLRKTIIFVKGKPGKLQISTYKQYGITDIVYFENYDSMYTLLFDAWKESQCISEDEIIGYENINILDIKSSQEKENQDFFFWGQGLLNPKELQLRYPYYFISRDISSKIITSLNENKIHLVNGSRISGKSYLLAGLYRDIRDRRVCYFDGRSKLSKISMQKLINYEKSLVLFDVGALTREQFEFILEHAKVINKNRSNFIICVNDSDNEISGIIKYRITNGKINKSDIVYHYLENKFRNGKENSEREKINKLLPAISLPPYREKHNILDHLIYSEDILERKSQFTRCKIKIENYKQLALLLILAIKEKISSLEIISFALDQEIALATKKYSPFIERVEVLNYEKNASDLSSIKYVLNSKYWLRRELGIYAQHVDNYNIIITAYEYIIHRIILASGSDISRQRKNFKNYIIFDMLNNIFLNKYGGAIKLIVNIYNKLHEQLATDYHFLHQNAKCLINYSYSLKNEEIDERKSLLMKAKKLSIVSKSIIEKIYDESGYDHLLISIDHVQFTIAYIQCNMCVINKYSNIEEIKNTIDIVYDALNSNYNRNNKEINKNSRNIVSFIMKVYKMLRDDESMLYTHKDKIIDLMNFIKPGSCAK